MTMTVTLMTMMTIQMTPAPRVRFVFWGAAHTRCSTQALDTHGCVCYFTQQEQETETMKAIHYYRAAPGKQPYPLCSAGYGKGGRRSRQLFSAIHANVTCKTCQRMLAAGRGESDLDLVPTAP